MTIGQRLRRAMERVNLTQVELSRLSGIDRYTINDILNGRRDPQFETVRRLVAAIGTTWADLFDEPRVVLSHEEAESLRASRDVLERLLANDAAQKAASPHPVPVHVPRRRLGTPARAVSMVRDSNPRPADEVEPSPEPIPEWHYRQGARRAFTVMTDSMMGAGILEGATIYVRMTIDLDAADGQIVVCSLNGTRYLKRLDLRGGRTTLETANPRYPTLTVTEEDEFALLGVVVMQPQ